MFGVVRIRGEEVHCVAFEQPVCSSPNAFSPVAGYSGGCDLYSATQFHPFQNPLRVLLQNRIAFWMRNDRANFFIPHLGEILIDLGWDAVLAEYFTKMGDKEIRPIIT